MYKNGFHQNLVETGLIYIFLTLINSLINYNKK